MKGLAEKTLAFFNTLSKLECIKDYTLIGGTALSLQIHHRLSEDLDFCQWKQNENTSNTVDWNKIKTELETIGIVQHIDLLDFNQVNFIVNGVKLSFYANNLYSSPVQKSISFLNNIVVADVESIGIMKIELMLRRSTFRDYYDL